MKKHMRQTYSLSDETRLVISDHVKAVANEMGKVDKYIYAILAGTETDRFPQFLAMYSAAVRAGAPVEHWDNRMAAIRARYAKAIPEQSTIECLTEKITNDAATTALLIDAMADGEFDAREVVKIKQAIEKERENLLALERHLHVRQVVK